MGRILAFDYGTRRVGVAVTDPLRIIANGISTIHPKDIIVFLKKYISENVVDEILVGLPRHMNNEASDVEKQIIHFINTIKKNFPQLPVNRYDERFTSKIAAQTMYDAGLNRKKRQNKALIDQISATIILMDYLEYLQNKK